MGSFAYTCGISGLPIEAGQKVRYFLVSKNPYNDSRACGINDVWVPRTFPLRAEYNDYGSVENIQEGPERDVWLEGFEIDLVERGWGDNSIHDVAVKKGMTFDGLLNAIIEGRLLIKRETRHEFKAMDEALKLLGKTSAEIGIKKSLGKKIPKGIPTLRRIQRAFERAGLALYSGTGGGGLLVDQTAYGEVRVRFQDWGGEFGKDEEYLAKAVAALKGRYATMISAGEGAYSHKADLTVRPRPGTEGFHGRKGLKGSKKPLAINHVMVREDVWQSMLTLKAENWSGGKRYTIKDYHAFADDFIKEVERITAEETKRNEALIESYKTQGKEPPAYLLDVAHVVSRVRSQAECMYKNPIAAMYSKNALPFSVGLATHWNLLADKGQLTRDFVRMAAEFSFIQRVLSTTRHHWEPSYSCGPQFGEWEAHVERLKATLKVAEVHAKRQKDTEEITDVS